MAVTDQTPAPYAPASAVLEVVNRYREKGLPTPINADVLGRAGISQSLLPRTLQALQTLDLIDDKGMPTPAFEGLRRASQGEFKQRMAEWLNAAYADVLNFIDPATADETAIRDAFRNYNPVGQQSRMVTLFSGLYAAAGIGPEPDKKQSASRPGARTGATSTKPRVLWASRAGSIITPRKQSFAGSGEMPPALAGLLASLPSSGTWTRQERDKFLATFGSVLDFCFQIAEPAADNETAGAK